MSKEKEINPTENRNGLKIRRAEAPKQKSKQVKRPKSIRPKRKEQKKGTANSGLLVFPTDRLGITSELKAAMKKVARRVGTDKDTLELVDDTLAILRKHVHDAFKQNNSIVKLKRRGDVDVSEVQEDQEASKTSEEANLSESEGNPHDKDGDGDVEYNEMRSVLKEAGVTPVPRKKEEVEEAYAELQEAE